MNRLSLFCIFIWVFMAGAYVGKARGLKEARNDVDVAGVKLSQCQEVITHNAR